MAEELTRSLNLNLADENQATWTLFQTRHAAVADPSTLCRRPARLRGEIRITPSRVFVGRLRLVDNLR